MKSISCLIKKRRSASNIFLLSIALSCLASLNGCASASTQNTDIVEEPVIVTNAVSTTIEATKSKQFSIEVPGYNTPSLNIYWTASTGNLSSTNNATTTWTAPAATGTATINITISNGTWIREHRFAMTVVVPIAKSLDAILIQEHYTATPVNSDYIFSVNNNVVNTSPYDLCIPKTSQLYFMMDVYSPTEKPEWRIYFILLFGDTVSDKFISKDNCYIWPALESIPLQQNYTLNTQPGKIQWEIHYTPKNTASPIIIAGENQ